MITKMRANRDADVKYSLNKEESVWGRKLWLENEVIDVYSLTDDEFDKLDDYSDVAWLKSLEWSIGRYDSGIVGFIKTPRYDKNNGNIILGAHPVYRYEVIEPPTKASLTIDNQFIEVSLKDDKGDIDSERYNRYTSISIIKKDGTAISNFSIEKNKRKRKYDSA